MSRTFLFTLAVIILQITANCDLLCDHTIYGSVNTKLIVDGTNCVLSGASANGPVHVKNGGNLTLENGSHVNADVKLENAGNFMVMSATTSSRISSVTDVGGVGYVIICGATLSSGFSSTGRVGPIRIGYGTCADTITYGPVSVTGGEGPFALGNIKSHVPTITVSDRDGRIDVENIQAVSTITITGIKGAKVTTSTVYDKITIKDSDGFANIAHVSVNGVVTVQNVSGFVCLPALRSTSTTKLIDTTGGIGLFDSTFNNLICEGNDFGSYGYIQTNEGNTVTSGTEQCSHLSS